MKLPQAFPSHLVEMSPWPILASFQLFACAMSAAAYFTHLVSAPFLLAALTGMAAVMGLWFRDVANEAAFNGDHVTNVQAVHAVGMIIFLGTEVMVFVSIFWAFFHSALAPTVELGAAWPPAGITPLDPFEVPLLNTVLLLSSGAALTYAHHALVGGHRGHALLGFALTLVMAVIFTGLQADEYANAPFTLVDSVYGSTFYLGTGTHGFHVIIGTTFLAVAAFRLWRYEFTRSHHVGLNSAAVYWHLVDVVWLFLYVTMYYWAS
jgi:cytochrome c oxidase subunit 3